MVTEGWVTVDDGLGLVRALTRALFHQRVLLVPSTSSSVKQQEQRLQQPFANLMSHSA